MTTIHTDQPTGIGDPCPNCAVPLVAVEGTDITNCNSCGSTFGHAKTQPEVIAPQPRAEIERRQPDNEQMARALQDALEHQSIPDREQFLTMAQTALMLSRSQGVPEALRNPNTAFHVVMMGRALNLDPATAINLIDVIGYDPKNPDKPVQLSLSPELLIARVKMMGLGSVELIERTKVSATAVALRPEGYIERDELTGKPTRIVGELGRVTFDWDGAMDAELVDDRCLYNPETGKVVHWKKVATNGRGWSNGSPNGCRCRGYKTYPENMFAWRALGYAAHAHFAQATLGIYSPEELGASVDEHGRAIDVATLDLPEGYESAAINDPPDPGAEPCPPEDIALIKARVDHLPDDERAQLKERWGDKIREGRLGPVDQLTVRGHNIAKALVNGAEQLARSHHAEWKPYEAPDPADSPPEAAGEPTTGESTSEAPAGAETATETPVEPEPGTGQVEQPTLGGEAVPQIDPRIKDHHIDQAMAAVKIMTPRALNAALRERLLKVDGVDENVRRQNLSLAMALELAVEEEGE